MRDMMRDAPTFRPTKAEMADFSAYVSKIMPQAAEFGICKVVPPKSWEGPPTTAPPDDLVIRGAIQQHVMGSHGVYSIVNQVQKLELLPQLVTHTQQPGNRLSTQKTGCQNVVPNCPTACQSYRIKGDACQRELPSSSLIITLAKEHLLFKH